MSAVDTAPTLYRKLLGARCDRLPASVRRLHDRTGLQRYRGEVSVVRGRSWLSRLCAWAARLPPQTHGAIEVEIDADAHGERWVRRFDGHAMPSRLWAQEGLLCERLGLLRFAFVLEADESAVLWRVQGVHALGIALPQRWFDGVTAMESESEGRYRYDVRAELPVAGLLVHYWGWLDVG
ncbi:MAG: DUF4166 domain-containing protein [Lysobacter sp.]|nr:DUF4166 domain-containing protein [Lysobacter sp.]